mmetsp:Transcript_30896/g.74049  ORF Transcript_30896/g.74049 Transcript_30896/m.74049 type:complete len:266 (+) Transcript_30896:1110-1907(+)
MVLTVVVMIVVVIVVESTGHSRMGSGVVILCCHPPEHVHVQHSSEPQGQRGPLDGLLSVAHVEQVQHPDAMGKEGDEEPDVEALGVLEPHNRRYQHADRPGADQHNGRKLLQGAPRHVNQQQQLRGDQKNCNPTDRGVGCPVLEQADAQHVVRKGEQQLVDAQSHEDTCIGVKGHVVHLCLLDELHMSQISHDIVMLAVQLVRGCALLLPPWVNGLRRLLRGLRRSKGYRSRDLAVVGLQGVLVDRLGRADVFRPLFLQDLLLAL